MSVKNQCPQCAFEIARERLTEKVVICNHCGWTKNSFEIENDYRGNMRNVRLTLAISALFIVGFIQAVNWDQYFFTIVPLKAKQTFNVATMEDLEQIAKICKERGKPSCIEKAYADAVDLDPENLAARALYGKILSFVKKDQMSIAQFEEYFRRGGVNLDAAYDYAQVLKRSGDVEEASRYFQFILKAKPRMLQVTVTQSYVDMLISDNQLKKAKRLIEGIRRKGSNTGYFMETELKDIKDRMAKTGSTRI